jgi:hypothetical protein
MKIKTTEIKKLEKLYLNLKEQLKKQHDSETLKKYQILSRAYKIGKLLNRNFSVFKLAKDFGLPYTTTKRILSLDRMSNNTKKLLKAKKISAFQVAQICSTKNRQFQDEIVKLVVEKKLSTQDIKNLKPHKLEDVKKFRLDKAVSQGFSRKYTAYKSLMYAVERLNTLLQLHLSDFPDVHLIIIQTKLKETQENISKFLNETQKYQALHKSGDLEGND